MDSVSVWTVLAVVSVLGLFLFWRGPNAVWGAITFGLIIAGIYQFAGSGFRWSTVGKWVVVSALAGFATEAIWRITRRDSN